MAGIVTLFNEWAIRVVVPLSLGAHVVVTLLASVRRRQGLGVPTGVLWLAYQLADWATPYALSKLSLLSTPRDQRIIALWVPFLLAHFAGPDNIAAYSLEDDKLSGRKVVSTLSQAFGAPYALYWQVYMGSDQALLWASVVMVFVSFAKCLLKAWAFRKAGFAQIRSATEDHQPMCFSIIQAHGGKLNDEKALLLAHQLLHITKAAFADFSVDNRDDRLRKHPMLEGLFHGAGRRQEDAGWHNMCKVVEMELSLMYDILYTKAAVIHTWLGYFVCAASPVATATVGVLFWLYRKDGHRRVDVYITYCLVVVTFLLDVRWLLRAAASTWAYAFFNARPASWLRHHVFCSGKWHCLRRAIVSLDPRQLLLQEQRASYRLWSGTIGSYNLFDDCTDQYTRNPLSKLVKVVAPEDTWADYEYYSWKGFQLGQLGCKGQHVIRKLLFDQIRATLKKAFPRDKPKVHEDEKSAEKPPIALAPLQSLANDQKTYRDRRKLDAALGFVPEFQELILTLHVATDVFFLCNNQQLLSQEQGEYKKAIQVVSNYMAFLTAARPDMLPGLMLRSLYSVTRRTLLDIREHGCGSSRKDKQQLARCLVQMEKPNKSGSEESDSDVYRSELYRQSGVLSDGIILAQVLQRMLKCRQDIKSIMEDLKMTDDKNPHSKDIIMFFFESLETKAIYDYECCDNIMAAMLKLILEMWVRMLIFVSIRCDRDSHAKQLGRGSDLTTIVWILVDHASVFLV
ncbi:unnamed protein product [Urochloa decumbens]|uniref:DUF4220 domain-containing protein n=1 Tax=Urochloa decumbens TaxID=240449 RepID=A0ABC9EGZ6_9POAL